MGRVMRKQIFAYAKTKALISFAVTAKLQRLSFRYTDSTISLLSKSRISSLKPFSVLVQFGVCRTWSETPKTGFLAMLLIYIYHIY